MLKNPYGGYNPASSMTHIAGGTSAATFGDTTRVGLLANAGSYDLPGAGDGAALHGATQSSRHGPESRAVLATLRRQMTDSLELFAEFSDTSNKASDPTIPASIYRWLRARRPIHSLRTRW